MAKPRAIAPRIMPAYDKNTSSLNLNVYLQPQITKAYSTMITDKSLPIMIMKNSYPMKDGDQSDFRYPNIPTPTYEKIMASEKYPRV